MSDELKMYKDMYYSYKNLAYTRQEALRSLGVLLEDPNEPPEEKVRKAQEILGYVGANPRVISQDNG